ncbi:disease resistance protein RUN1-like isoform X2 [Malus sylvestris]|uniref:disease resistance protein RUN1-like isoform X2 n=1 Tax=Malus sylvestris TaxID=3752 RepID=UPI0021ACCCAF|nr:disease resistance protein RUN1-like isoform X2 [Malus sylvestris]
MENPGSKYDVFLSFRGEETRMGITDHLYCTLKDYKFNVFLDEDELPRGDGISGELTQAIKGSRLAAIVFSKRYAESRWCLQELVQIMECRKLGQLVFPIFYDVDPSDVRHQTGSFATAFQNHEQRFTKEKVQEWREALTAAAELSGEHFQVNNGNEGNFIRNVVSQITGKLSRNNCLVVPTKLVGIDSRVREISKHLDVGGSNDVRIIGILGMCGLGKTTVAKAVFNKHHHSFDGASFLETASEEKLVDLQKKLISDILKQAYILVSSINEGTKEIKQRLGNRRVLVVIDDLDSVQQRDALAIKPDSFGPGSRIIITSRNEHLLKIINVDKICPLPAMNEGEALELLSWHAFRNNYPNEEYIELSRKAVGYCGGLPLTLEVLGSYIRTGSTSEWETVLDKWKRSQPYREIHRRLKISYDGLTDDDVKAIFLDISCFFTGMNKDYVMTVLDGCQFYPEIGIRELQDQCLVTVDKEGNLMMHDLIQGMGREIVRAESPDNPGERSRLWHNEDITDVLTKQSGTEDVEGLALDMQESDECSFSTEAFGKMQSLRLLKLNNIKLTGSYDNLSKELRWLCWHGFPLKVIPEDFDQSNLVAIDLSYSKLIRVWVDTDVLLKNLKIINLSHSHYLTESPDLSKIPNLEKLILVNCVRLSKIHPSIGHLERLSLVNLEDCKTLQYLPGDFCKSKSVETLILKGCTGFIKLKDKGEMVSSTTLQASHTMTMKLPSSIAGLKNLRSVLLSLHGLSSLTLLGLGNCGLTDDAIPKDLGSLFSLEILELDGNLFYSLPSLSGLSKLKMLDLSYCKNLLEIPDLPRSLEILRANHCIALAKLPNFSEMSSMVELHLNHSPKLTEILGLHKSLNTMRRIHMEGCTNLTADFRKNIILGWTSCGHGDIFLSGIYDIPEWFQIVGIHEPNDVRFKVPRNFRGLTVCCVFETYCPGFTVTNITKRKALHTWDESTCWVADSVLRLQSVLSNDVLHLQSGDEVSISAVTKAHGRGRVIGRVMKTGVNLVWDDGNAGDKYTSIEEIGAVPRNNSSEETLPSPSVHTDGCLPMASDLEKCANEAFIDDCFKLAVDLYTHAIAFNPQSAELYTNRAQANIKSGNLTEAVADANKAIEFDPLSYKAYLRKGIACIKLKEYQTAKATLEIGAPLAPHETRFANLIKECDEKIAEETAVLPTASLENITENVIPAKDVQPASQPSNQVTVASVKPKYRPEFYQKPEEVVVTIFAEGIPAKDVNVDFGEQKLGVSIDVAGEDTYYFQTHLFGKIIPEMCRFDVLSTKVEIRLAKAEPLHWTSLEFSEDNPVPLKVTGPVVGVPSPSYLSSKPRTNPVTVHPMPSNDANQPDGNTIVKAEPRSFIASGFSLSEEQHDVAGPPVKHRKQHRIKYAQNQEPSLLRGVYFKNMKWHAAIKVDKKQIHLGTVGSQEEAAHLYDRAAFMCGREPNFELSEEEKQELRKFKWDEFLVMTRHAITNKKHMRRQGAESEKRSESPQLEDSDWEDDQEEVSGLSASEDAEQDMSDS